MKERIALSGQSGFLGSHLSKSLEQLGHEVVSIKRDGIVPKDIDWIFDLATYGNNQDQKDVFETFNANIIRTLNVIETGCDAKAIVLTSSSSVLLKFQTPYSISKHSMEETAKWYAQNKNLPVVVIRPSTIIGVGEQSQHLIPTLIRSCMEGTEMPFVGYPTHDFLDIEDFIEGIIMIAKNVNLLKSDNSYIVNISSGKSYTNSEVKELVEEITGQTANIKKVDNLRAYDSKKWQVPNNKMRALGWYPVKSLRKSIKEMVFDYRKKHRVNSFGMGDPSYPPDSDPGRYGK